MTAMGCANLARWGYGVVLVAVCAAVLGMYTDFTACVQCAVLERIGRPVPWSEEFLPCSNIVQHIDREASHNIREERGEVEGWVKITAADPAKEATVVVGFKKTPGQRRVVFYPRVSGEGSEVTVHEDVRAPGLLFLLRGQPGVWSPLGGQYPFNFLCLEYGFQIRKSFEARVVITLRGPGAQVWQKDGLVFF